MLASGDKIGRYTLVRQIGQGASGVVFEALDTALGRNVALKWMRVSLRGNDGLAERFLRGARSAARIVDRGAATILDIGVWEDHLFVVMELLHGRTLDVQLASRPHGIGEIITQLIPAMLAVQAAHQLQIVHRDIKPSNLFAVTEGDEWRETKVLDFGSAKWLESEDSIPGSLVGTPLYMEPEQLSGQPIDHRADIYAFGLVCYEAIAGVLPFPTSGSQYELLLNKRLPHAGLRAHAPEAPVELEAVIARAIAVQPGERYASIAEFVEALRPFAGSDVMAIARANSKGLAPRTLATTLMPALSTTAGSVALATSIFGGHDDRVAALRDKVRFYNDTMAAEYQQMTYLVRSAHVLWLVCVAATFAIMLPVVLLVAYGHWETAIVAGIADVMAGLVSTLFQRREDHYRQLSEQKRAHLEYGQEWATTLNSIDAMKQEARKEELLERLIETQIDRLRHKSRALAS